VGDIPGTLAYISPERLRGEPAGPAADVWAVGVLLWEALAGFHPFWIGTLVETAKAIEKGAPSLREQRPDLPRPIVSCVDRALSVSPGRRPTAAGLAGSLRAAARELRRRPVARPARRHLRLAAPSVRAPSLPTRPIGPREAVEHGRRALAAGGAAAAAGLSAHVLPFFPSGWPLGLAAAAAVTSLFSERAGLAFCLAVPLLPIGNYALGLAALYAVAALIVLVGFWRAPRAGLLAALGAGLGAIGALGLLPVLALALRRPAWRAAGAAVAVLVAAALAGAGRIGALGVPGTDSLLTAGRAVAVELAGDPRGIALAAALALGAAALPFVRGRGPLAAAAYGLAVCGITIAAPPHAANAPVLALTAVTALALALEPYAKRSCSRHARRPQQPVEETTAAVEAPQRIRAAGTGG
jgi:hypothetical protein